MVKPNPAQFPPSKEQKAILAVKKDTIVISNPGTGKTTTLGFKVVDLLDSGEKPEDILCITFTEKAKKEMQDKLFEMAKMVFKFYLVFELPMDSKLPCY